jgi:hypothetical protein
MSGFVPPLGRAKGCGIWHQERWSKAGLQAAVKIVGLEAMSGSHINCNTNMATTGLVERRARPTVPNGINT